MKFSIDKSELITALDTAIKAVSSKSTLAILEGFLLEADGEELRVTGHDLEIGIQATAKCEVLRPGKIVINANLFSNVIKKMPDSEIDLTLNGSELIIESGKMITKVATAEPKGYPGLPSAKGGQVIEIEQQELKELISKTLFAVSVDENRAALCGALIQISNGNMEVVAVDGFRFAIRRAAAQDINFNAIIHGKTLSELAKILKTGKIKVYKNGNLVMFEAESYFMTSRTLEGAFLNYKSLIQDKEEVSVEVKTKDIQSALEMAVLLLPSSDMKVCPPIIFNIEDKFSASYRSEKGQNNNDIPADITGPELKAAFNPKYLLEALKVVEDEKVNLGFMGKNLPLKITPIKGDKFLHYCLAVRVPEA